MAKWDRRTKEFKAKAVERMKGCPNVRALARELGVCRETLYQWTYEAQGEAAQKRPKPPASANAPGVVELKKEITDLKLALADKTLEASFFKGALQRVEDRRRTPVSSGGSGSTIKSQR